MIIYLDSSRGISAGLVLGALLDAGADATLVQRILGTVTLPRISLMRGRKRIGAIAGTAASVAIGPVRSGTPLIDATRALVKEADRFARTQGYRWVYRHCDHNDLPVMLQWKRVGYAITAEDFSTGSIHMRKVLQGTLAGEMT